MFSHSEDADRRILVVDDNPGIHQDVRKILAPRTADSVNLAEEEAALFGDAASDTSVPEFHIDSAMQGEEGVEMVRLAREQRQPFAVAFVDARMPPGCDGVETIARIWEQDPDVQIVLCTAHADHSWRDIRKKLSRPEQLIILKKPFDNIEVQQLAEALTEKWRSSRKQCSYLRDLEQRIAERKHDAEVRQGIDAQLAAPSGSSSGARSPAKDTVGLDRRRQALEVELQRALLDERLTVHYQPLVDIASRRVVSLEALLRWQHPELGAISPAEFVPIAEASGLIVPIGEFVLQAVCRQIVRWERAGVPVVPIAVNVSGAQLERVDIFDCVRRILRAEGVQPQCVALELTESTVMKDPSRYTEALQKLRGDGVLIEIDDFGTGYSSLSYLKSLPIDAIKIDRSFIRHLEQDTTDQAIVSAILAMARSLGLRVTAEGVETPGQLEVLGRSGCQVAQGFYFCKPIPGSECEELLLDLSARSSFTETLRIRALKACG